MALTQAEADAFMQAEKTVPAGADLRWQEKNNWASCRAPVEIDAAQVGQLVMVASVEVSQYWTFKLTYRGDEAYQLHIRPIGNHPNPANRPSGFPRKVPERVHEHVYVEGLDTSCARAFDDQSIGDHADMFRRFCERARLNVEAKSSAPPYVRPRLGA